MSIFGEFSLTRKFGLIWLKSQIRGLATSFSLSFYNGLRVNLTRKSKIFADLALSGQIVRVKAPQEPLLGLFGAKAPKRVEIFRPKWAKNLGDFFASVGPDFVGPWRKSLAVSGILPGRPRPAGRGLAKSQGKNWP